MRVLLVTNSDETKPRLQKLLSDYEPEIKSVSSLPYVSNAFKASQYDIMLLNSECCSTNGNGFSAAISTISTESPRTRVILLVRPEDIEVAMKGLRAGSYQYVRLPVSDEELKSLLTTAYDLNPRTQSDRLSLKAKRDSRLGKLLGRSSRMHAIFEKIHTAADNDIPVLLTGETGTGKDLVARTIHDLSERKKSDFIPVNLGALPMELVASELFGHEKGAFTGATDQRSGVFERGSKGTVFLDEIDCIDEKVRVSLLRLIEEKEFRRLGGKQTIDSNARLITATNSDLERLVKEGKFREDLYYRLDVFRINLPPLRERREDIPLIIDDLISRFNKSLNKRVRSIAPNVMEILQVYEWPGNVRELRNVIQRTMLVCSDGKIKEEHLPGRLRSDDVRKPKVTFPVGTPLDQVERDMILRCLSVTGNNRTRAAELLGISRRALYNKLKTHKIN